MLSVVMLSVILIFVVAPFLTSFNFQILSCLVALSQAAPSNYAAAPVAAGAHVGYAAAPAGYAVAEAAPVAAVGYAAPVTAVQVPIS